MFGSRSPGRPSCYKDQGSHPIRSFACDTTVTNITRYFLLGRRYDPFFNCYDLARGFPPWQPGTWPVRKPETMDVRCLLRYSVPGIEITRLRCARPITVQRQPPRDQSSIPAPTLGRDKDNFTQPRPQTLPRAP